MHQYDVINIVFYNIHSDWVLLNYNTEEGLIVKY
jgi:hypothetical protein